MNLSKNLSIKYAATASLITVLMVYVLNQFELNNVFFHKGIEIGVLVLFAFLLLGLNNNQGSVKPKDGFISSLTLGIAYAILLPIYYFLIYFFFDINLASSLFQGSTFSPISIFIMTGFEFFAYTAVIGLLVLQYYKKPTMSF